MSLFAVSDSCIECGLCAELCPAKIIEGGGKPRVAEALEKKCIGCGQCVSFCPQSCCYLDFQPVEERIPVDAGLFPSAESGETFLRSRRSIRRFKETPPSRDTVDRIIETTRYAPSASNLQMVRWIVTGDRAKTVALAGLVADCFERQAAADTPESRTLASIAKVWRSGTDIIFRGAPLLAVAVVDKSHIFPAEDTAIALTYFELAAHAHGIGCCWAGFFTLAAKQDPAIRKAIGCTEDEIVGGGQMLGHARDIGLSRILPPRRKTRISWI